ncbi:MAG: MotA/TolQ/ExbB proton channel family protein [Luteolibacter sp.]
MLQAIQTVLHQGGPTLWALMVLALMIYTLLFRVWRELVETRRLVANHAWEKPRALNTNLPWQAKPPPRRRAERDYATFELDNLAWINRRIPFLTVLISAAPLLGLLGTVAGMLITFSGMAGEAGGAPIDTISTGISKALLTTQAGLVIAVPAAFFLALIKRRADLAHLELQRQLHTRLANSSTTP